LQRFSAFLGLYRPTDGLPARAEAGTGDLNRIRVVQPARLKICDWIEVLDFGRPLMAGTPAEVRASDEVRLAYLGKSNAT